MEFNISDLLDGFEEESVEIQPCTQASWRHIEELVMKNIHTENKPSRRRKPGIAKLILVAAIIVAMCGTVYAGNMAIRFWYDDTENSGVYFGETYYTRGVLEYPLEPVQIKETAMRFLADRVNQCNYWWLEGNTLTGLQHFTPHKFESLEITENFFDMEFVLPDIVREGEVYNREVRMQAIPMYYPETLPEGECYDIVYEPDLGGACLDWGMKDTSDSGLSVGVDIYMGFTKEFCAVPYVDNRSYYDRDAMGEPGFQEKRIGNKEFTIMTFSDLSEPYMRVCYVCDGIGYELSFSYAEGIDGSQEKLEKMVIKCLKDFE